MRWPFGRRSQPAATGAEPAVQTDREPAAAVPARPAGEWRHLPAIQRSVSEPPLIAPSVPFQDQLELRQPAPVALAPLGHEVSHLAEPGLVVGLTRPAAVSPSSPRPALTLRPTVQRQAAESDEGPTSTWSASAASPDAGSATTLEWASSGAADIPAGPPPSVAEPVADVAAAAGAPASTSGEPPAPIAPIVSVSRLAVSPTLSLDLRTDTGSHEGHGHEPSAIGPAVTVAPETPAAGIAPLAAPAAFAIQRLTPQTTLTRLAATPTGAEPRPGVLTLAAPSAGTGDAAAVQRMSIHPGTPDIPAHERPRGQRQNVDGAAPPVQRLTVGQVRRLGLGAPLAAVPKPVQREAASAAVSASAPAMPLDQRTVEAPAGLAVTSTVTPGDVPQAGPASAPIAISGVILPGTPEFGGGFAAAPAPAHLAAALVQRSAARPAVRPVLGPPLGPGSIEPMGAPVQRDAVNTPGATAGPTGGASSMSTAAFDLARLQRQSADNEPTAGDDGEGDGSRAVEPPTSAQPAVQTLQRSAAAADAPDGSADAGLALDTAIVAPVSAVALPLMPAARLAIDDTAAADAAQPAGRGAGDIGPSATAGAAAPSGTTFAAGPAGPSIQRSISDAGTVSRLPIGSLAGQRGLRPTTAANAGSPVVARQAVSGVDQPTLSRTAAGSSSAAPVGPLAASPTSRFDSAVGPARPAFNLQRTTERPAGFGAESPLPLWGGSTNDQSEAWSGGMSGQSSSDAGYAGSSGGGAGVLMAAGGPAVQTMAESSPMDAGPVSWPETDAGPAVQRAVGGAAGAAAAGGGDAKTPEELDKLAEQLYGRLKNQLTRELLLDRERAGLIGDFR